MNRNRFALVVALLAMFAASLPAKSALAERADPRVKEAVGRALDWVASTQSRLGHWSANDGRYPTAMTALAGPIATVALPGRYQP